MNFYFFLKIRNTVLRKQNSEQNSERNSEAKRNLTTEVGRITGIEETGIRQQRLIKDNEIEI